MTTADKNFLDRLTQLVDKNLSDCSMSTETLAQVFCITSRHFSRRVKEVTGVDTTHFIRSRRVAQACHLLEHTDLPISEIYIKCGIESANYFSRVFKMEMGMTPTEYRNSRS